jgi:branched-subunit amino acid aminotransferase/4-amino-4-deoxychorismate lyase
VGVVQTYIQANTNGRLHDAAEPSLTVLDRSFLYGDAVYEVWRTVHGIVFAFDEHFERLEASARALFLQLPFDREGLLSEMQRTCGAFVQHAGWQGDLYIRLQLSRGGGPIGLDPALAAAPTFVLIVQPLRGWPHDEPATGELIYLLDPALWGRGLATRMAWTAVDRAFRSAAIGQVLAVTDGGNRASQRLMARLGMRHRREVDNPLGPGPECVLARGDAGPAPRPPLLPIV